MRLPSLLNFRLGSTSEPTGESHALSLFYDAARRVPAYRNFLERHSIRPESIETIDDFQKLPRTDKPSYFSQYSLKELSWDGKLSSARYISTSSGSTGVPFFWPRGVAQDTATGLIFKKIYEDIFEIEGGKALFVNSFGLGAWIAGFEFYNATKWVGDSGTNVTIVTPGIDREEALRQIKKLTPLYPTIILAGYPPFIKDIIEEGETLGIDWKAIDIRLLVAGEAVSIIWKNKLLARIGKSYAHFVNVYGMAECGVVAHDTPVSQLLREHADKLPVGLINTQDGLPVTGMYQFNPSVRYFESAPGEALALTANAGLPLIRYDTRDTGGILERSTTDLLGEAFRSEAERLGIDLNSWLLPFIYLNGRKDLSISLYALMIYVENVKYALEASAYAPLLSGLFTMSVEHTPKMDQEFRITVELENDKAPRGLALSLAKEIIGKLCAVNSEYAKLYNSLGAKVKPKVILVPRGSIQTVPGRKHKWVKRT
jgi:phenylacetate-CoA ligase